MSSERKPYKPPYKGRLKRLPPEFYRGHSAVHWTLTIQDKAVGWLNDRHHLNVRRVLFHTLARYRLACPAYCLMPDHGHFLWIGLEQKSDQLLAMRAFRKGWNEILAPHSLSRQAYDHVLRGEERDRDALLSVCHYIYQNPVRKDWVSFSNEWSWQGISFPGYPTLDSRKHHCWQNFWKAYAEQCR